MKVSTISRKPLSHIITIDVDFTINKTLPQFTYSPNNTINSISVPFHSLSDSVLERSETAVFEIRLYITSRFIQIHSKVGRRATITILDNPGKIALYNEINILYGSSVKVLIIVICWITIYRNDGNQKFVSSSDFVRCILKKEL